MSELTNEDAINSWSQAPIEAIAQFGDEGDFARQYLLNPAIFACLGDVAGKYILDAGCGQGYLCRLLARKGAIVTGVEPAVPFYQYAVERERQEQLGISYIQHDLSTLPAQKQIFDCVVANMVFMDIPDYQAAMHNCIAALKHGGIFVFSLVHPCFEESGSEWARKGYVEVREYLQEYAAQQDYAYLFHRPLSAYINFLIQESCTLRAMIEPRLDAPVAQQDARLERYVHVPGYVVLYATRNQGNALRALLAMTYSLRGCILLGNRSVWP
jgi:2-polyprenyl-3-methyl-5-hydroxy-6-metoxy-1,4-benzoquinol methylase